jgi:hypothetical protein
MSARRNLPLLAVSCGIALAIGECGVRLLRPDLAAEDTRLILTTTPLVRGPDGDVRYPPHQEVRSALLVAGQAEFDVRFRTNNLGLIDHRDYPGQPCAGGRRTSAEKAACPPAPGRRYAIVGDSYAAGVEGGEPWIPVLRDRLGLEIYNLGTGGAGIGLFGRALAALRHTAVPTDIVIVALSDDFLRPVWYPDLRGDEIRFCVEEETPEACRQRTPIAYLVAGGWDPAMVAARAAELRQRRAAARPGGVLRRIARTSKLATALRRFAGLQLQRRAGSGLFTTNVAALRRIREEWKEARIQLVHVPDKMETRRARYDADLRGPVEAAGIEYTPLLGRCPWSTDLYHLQDNHPNREGYRRLAACVAALARLGPPAEARAGAGPGTPGAAE